MNAARDAQVVGGDGEGVGRIGTKRRCKCRKPGPRCRPQEATATLIRHRIATPHGSEPTATSATLVLVAVSMTATAFERPHATYSLPPSGVNAMFHGRLPTGMRLTMVCVATSITCTVPSPPELT